MRNVPPNRTALSNLAGWVGQHIGKYAGNVAGLVWTGGSATQLCFGFAELSPRLGVASFLGISSSIISFRSGHTSSGVKASAAVGIIGSIFTFYPGLANLEPTSVFTFAVGSTCLALGACSSELQEMYQNSRNRLAIALLSNTRRTAGLGLAISKLPTIFASIGNPDRQTLLTCLLIWATGDIISSFAQPPPLRPQMLPSKRSAAATATA